MAEKSDKMQKFGNFIRRIEKKNLKFRQKAENLVMDNVRRGTLFQYITHYVDDYFDTFGTVSCFSNFVLIVFLQE